MKKLLRVFESMKFRQKLMISYIIISIIPITILGLFSYYRSKAYLQQQMEIAMKNNLAQISININNKLERQNKYINYLAFNTNLRDVLMSDSINPYLLSYMMRQSLDPMITNYLVINSPEVKEVSIYSDFRKIWLGEYIVPSQSVSNELWYNETSNSFNTMWWYEQNKIFASHSIPSNYANKFLGVIYVEFNMDEIFSDIEQFDTFEYELIIMNNENKQIYAGNNLKDERYKLKHQEIVNTNEGKTIINGNEYLIIKGEIAQAGWSLCLYVPINGVAFDTGIIIKATGMIILSCIIILIFLIWLLSKTFVRRIYSLINKIETIEKGNLDVTIFSTSKDEIGNLTNSFGRILGKVKSLMQEVYQSKLNEKESHLRLLQAQINPHFLYNSLSVINWKAINIGSTEISEITTLLSRFYRTTLNKGRSITTVTDEIANIKAYVTLQLIMHSHSFDVVYNFQDAIFEHKIINFVLQPIVENAIMHGIDKKEDGRGVLTILGYILNENIEFVIQDNGPGIKLEVKEKMFQSKNSGYGLRNVDERIKLFYGSDYGITTDCDYGSGTVMKVLLPGCVKDSNLA